MAYCPECGYNLLCCVCERCGYRGECTTCKQEAEAYRAEQYAMRLAEIKRQLAEQEEKKLLRWHHDRRVERFKRDEDWY